MASPSVIDIDELVQPLGIDLEEQKAFGKVTLKTDDTQRHATLRDKLSYLRQTPAVGAVSSDSDDDKSDEKLPDFETVQRECMDYLKYTGKDLEAAARLVEALTKLYGPPGLRDGFRLMRRMVNELWDYLLPKPDPEDYETIAGVYGKWTRWLGSDKTPYFPNSIKSMPIFLTDRGNRVLSVFSREEARKQIKEDTPEIDRKPIEAAKGELEAVKFISYESGKDALDDLTEALDEVTQLDAALTEKFNEDSESTSEEKNTGLGEVMRSIKECITLAKQFQKEGPSDTGGMPISDGPVGGVNGETGGVMPMMGGGVPGMSFNVGPMVNRDQILDNLKRIADMLRKLEPLSPVSYMIDRAVKIGRMSYPEMIKHLLRKDAGAQTNVFDDLDIDPNAGASSEPSGDSSSGYSY